MKLVWSSVVVLSAAAIAGLGAGCGDSVALGTLGQGGNTGGALSSGGVGFGGNNADAAVGAGGAQGGASGTLDAPISTGGIAGQTGGRPDAGGTAGAGGTSGIRCGTIAGLTCPSGMFCDLMGCGMISDAAGICQPLGGGCTADWVPVCGCDGKTYSNDCTRISAGVSKASDGACGGGGGATGTGGKSGTGGSTGAGGRSGATCGGYNGVSCPTGQFCDLDRCGTISDATGTCFPQGGGCIAVYDPVCGCDGKTYPSDCDRIQAGVYKASDGACAGGSGGATGTGGKSGAGGSTGGVDGGTANTGCSYQCRTDSSGALAWYSGENWIAAANCTGCVAACEHVGTKSEGCYASCPPGSPATGTIIAYSLCGGSYPTGYLAWEAPGGFAGTGPMVVVDASTGSAGFWENVTGLAGSGSTGEPTSAPSARYAVTRAETDELFTRLASINFSALPHPMTIQFHEASPRLLVQPCGTCAATNLKYESAKQLVPEMEPVWQWFDKLVGSAADNNPRNWANWD